MGLKKPPGAKPTAAFKAKRKGKEGRRAARKGVRRLFWAPRGFQTARAWLILCNGDAVRGLPEAFDFIGNSKVAGVPFQVIVVVILTIACYVALHRTSFGVMCFASGGNDSAARLSGINVRRIRMLAFVISGVAAAVSAIIATSRASSGLPTLGVNNTQMQAIAAAVIGGASLSGGRGTIAGTMLGVLFITILYNGANLVGVSPDVQELMIGSVILISAGIDLYRRNKHG